VAATQGPFKWEIKRRQLSWIGHTLGTNIQHYKTGPNMKPTGQEEERKVEEFLEV